MDILILTSIMNVCWSMCISSEEHHSSSPPSTRRFAPSICYAIRAAPFIRNKALALWRSTRGTNSKHLSRLAATLAKEFPFVAKLNSSARQQATQRAWAAIKRFYDNCKQRKPGKKGYPQFQHDNRSVEYKKSGWKLSDDCRFIRFRDGHRIGTLKLVGKQALNPFKDKIQRVQIVRKADGYYAHFVLKVQKTQKMAMTGSMVGLDLGLTQLWTDSNGDTTPNPRKLKASERALKRLQRRLSRKQKGSKNRHKQRRKLARKHQRVARQRKDFAVKAARALYESHDLIVLEDLRVQNLLRNHRLAKAISDASWSQLRHWIEYFAKVFGKLCVLVDPAYTTQECHACGRREPKALSQRWHQCACGCSLDRDHNAAKVILQRGLKQVKGTPGHGGTGSAQEPTPVDRRTSGCRRQRRQPRPLKETGTRAL